MGMMPVRNAWETRNIDYTPGLWTAANGRLHYPAQIHRLRTYVDEVDLRHRTNWRRTFPWLEQV